jgi:hypothetical protein
MILQERGLLDLDRPIDDYLGGASPTIQQACHYTTSSSTPISHTARRPHEIYLDMKLRDQLLNGAIYAVTPHQQGEGGAPDKRPGYAISYWAELIKAMSNE